MPDPVHLPGQAGLHINIPESGPNVATARQACLNLLQPVMSAKQAGNAQTAVDLQALINYARCMRAHDIGMLDPAGDGSLSLGDVSGINNNYGRSTPQFHDADAACRHFLPAGTPDDGTGP